MRVGVTRWSTGCDRRRLAAERQAGRARRARRGAGDLSARRRPVPRVVPTHLAAARRDPRPLPGCARRARPLRAAARRRARGSPRTGGGSSSARVCGGPRRAIPDTTTPTSRTGRPARSAGSARRRGRASCGALRAAARTRRADRRDRDDRAPRGAAPVRPREHAPAAEDRLRRGRPAERSSRAELVAIAHGYFDGIEQLDAELIAIREDCLRIENGSQTVLLDDVSAFAGTTAEMIFPMSVREQVQAATSPTSTRFATAASSRSTRRAGSSR